MPNPVAAAAEGLPTLNRRSLLRGVSVSTAAVLSFPVAAEAASHLVAAPSADAPLFALLAEHADAKALHEQALADLDWLVAEWRHLWPLAPEALLEFPNADQKSITAAERDLGGNFIRRDNASLSREVTRKYRGLEGTSTCFAVESVERLQGYIRLHEDYPVVRRPTPISAAKRLRAAQHLREIRRRMRMARAYEAEKARIRKISGVDRAEQHIRDMHAAMRDIGDRIMGYPAETMEGISAKVDFFITCSESGRAAMLYRDVGGIFGFGWSLAQDIQRLGAAA